MLLSRKGPIIQKSRPTPEAGVAGLSLKEKEESSEDEDDEAAKQRAQEEAKAQAAKDREEKQRKYEERRLELFGPEASSNSQLARPTSRSGGSSPANLTPPGSRSSTPHRGGKRGRGRGGNQNNMPRTQQPFQQQYQQQQQQLREVYDPNYAAKPNSTYLMMREQPRQSPTREGIPIREPRAPDGSGRGGAGFVIKSHSAAEQPSQIV